jgi:prepilin-type N-terminal cleavage/methylation domain-containing protein
MENECEYVLIGKPRLPMSLCAYLRSKSGFTLVEALVVSVIIAILAAVAIPLYSGMVKIQKRDAAKNIAQSAATSANIYYRRFVADPDCSTTAKCITSLGLFLPDPTRYTLRMAGNYLIASDVSNGIADSVEAAAAFR